MCLTNKQAMYANIAPCLSYLGIHAFAKGKLFSHQEKETHDGGGEGIALFTN